LQNGIHLIIPGFAGTGFARNDAPFKFQNQPFGIAHDLCRPYSLS
jgi:hypothetical protein